MTESNSASRRSPVEFFEPRGYPSSSASRVGQSRRSSMRWPTAGRGSSPCGTRPPGRSWPRRMAAAPGGRGSCSRPPGPGLINAVCGVATAQADRDPVVAITGQVPRAMRFKSYHQNLDTVGLFAPITKWSVAIEEPSTIPEVLANAFRVAARPRPGAVHVSVPSDVSRAAVQARPLPASDPAPGGLPPDALLDRAASLLQSARRPVLLLGVATGQAAATAAIRRLLREGCAAGGLHVRGQWRGPARPARLLHRPRRLHP